MRLSTRKVCLIAFVLAWGAVVFQPVLLKSGVWEVASADNLSFTITTVVGLGIPQFDGDGGVATKATINAPRGIAVDDAANLYIADTENHRIRRVDGRTGIIKTIAGIDLGSFGGDDGPATLGILKFPSDVVVNRAGDVLIADTGNSRIRRVNARTGTITTMVGTGVFANNGDGGLANVAAINAPEGIALDAAGNLFIADTGNHGIRRVDAITGIISTVAGFGSLGFGGDGGSALGATFNHPTKISISKTGDIYIADTGNNRIRRINGATGIISTVAGLGTPGFTGDGIVATSATLNTPSSILVDDGNSLFITDAFNQRIRRVDGVTGIINTIAGNGKEAYGGDNGPALTAGIYLPSDLALDGFGNLFIADTLNHRIRYIPGIGQGQKSPTVTDFSPKSGPFGTLVTITGGNFVNVRSIRINDVELPFSVTSPTEITATILPFTKSGPLSVTTSNGTVTSREEFTVGNSTFTLTAAPASQTITAGDTASFTVNVMPVNGSSPEVSLSAAVVPPRDDVTLSFSSALATPGAGAVLKVTTAATLPTTDLMILVTGKAGIFEEKQVVTLSVKEVVKTADFSLAVSPTNQTIVAGAACNFTLTVQPAGGFNQPVSLTPSVTPAIGVEIGLSATSITADQSAVLTVSSALTTRPAAFTITITGTAIGLGARSQQVTVTVTAAPDFSLVINPSEITVSRGQKGKPVDIGIERVGNFNGNVTVTPDSTQLKALKLLATPASQTTTGAGVSFTFKIKKGAPLGTHQLTFTGRDEQGRVRVQALTVVITDS